MIRKFLLLILLSATANLGLAQIGDKSDRPGEVQKSLVPRELIPPAPVLTPDEALKSFQLAPGFHIECIAHEPDIQDPVVAQFDPEGRLWVVEMRGFMQDLDGSNEDAPIGRIVVLTDTNHDGIMDTRTVFLDGLVLPRAIMFVNGGVLIGEPPHLWFCQDTNGDGKADEKIEIASDFGVMVDPKRPELANPEREPNALLWSIDNWIYGAAYMTRFKFEAGKWQHGLTVFRGQYGLSQDSRGRLFYNSNSDQLRYDPIPSEYLSRNSNFLHPQGNNVNAVLDQLVWPSRVNPGVNRGYRPESLRDGRLKEYTAACSPFVFYSSRFPRDFQGNAFIAEPAGNLIRRNVLTETNGSLTARNAYDKTEFLTSTDERFRPVNFFSGPDGALYVVDFHHGMLEHRISLTTYLRNQAIDRGLDKPVHYGRIFRIVPDGTDAHPEAQFSKETAVEWVKHLSDMGSWWQNTAQRLLVEKSDSSSVAPLKELALHGPNPEGRLHALWTLSGMKALEELTIEKALLDPSPMVRAGAVRLGETLFDSEDKSDVLAKIAELKDDASAEVQLQLALTLGQAHEPRYDQIMAGLASSSISNRFLVDAIVTGLSGRELDVLEKVLSAAGWATPNATQGHLLKELAACVVIERQSARIEKLMQWVAAPPSPPQQSFLLDGILATSGTTTRKPVKLVKEPTALLALKISSKPTISKRAEKAAALFIWPGKPGVKPEPPLTPLTAAQQARFENGKTLFKGTCAACHQLHGMGMDGLAPPLVDSEWVLGSEQRVVRILLNGLHGPIKINGKGYNLDMPSMAFFDDEQLASLLTYVRREWDNTGNPVEPEQIKAIRTANGTRQEAWSADELLKVP